jgi:hypothetical protein
MDFEVERCTRRCAASGRDLAEGETYFAALVRAGAALERQDFAAEVWTGPPDGALAWWKAQVPTRESKKARQTPSEVLLELFEGLEGRDDQADFRYVLALLLVRRRILRMEDPHEAAGDPTVRLYCPRLDKTYTLAATLPDDQRAAQIQEELSRLLASDQQAPPATPAAAPDAQADRITDGR